MQHDRHQQRQQRIKQQVDARISAAQENRGTLIVLTGNGKGKTTAAMGTVVRALGHGLKAAVIQFIKGQWPSGERTLLQQCGAEFHIMNTGFTWETQNRQTDTDAAQRVWIEARRLLQDATVDLLVLDELTYMVSYDYLDLDEILFALQNRPEQQTVIITGRGCHRAILQLADTVSEVRPVKHAFDQGIQARAGIDW